MVKPASHTSIYLILKCLVFLAEYKPTFSNQVSIMKGKIFISKKIPTNFNKTLESHDALTPNPNI